MDAATKQSWLKFYPTDWQGDELLAVCSLAARGLLMELICLMHRSVVYGHLLVNGRAPSDADLVRLGRATSLTELRKLKAELLSKGVLSTTAEGILFSRRMVRKAATATVNRNNGARGGNPALKKPPPDNRDMAPSVNRLDSGTVKTVEARSQKLEARDQKLDRTEPQPDRADARSKRPIFSGVRLTVFEWMLDDLRKMLGKHTETFDLHDWFFTLDAQAEREGFVIPQRDRGAWLLAQTLAEAHRRGLPIAKTDAPHPLGQSMFQPGTSAEELAAGARKFLEDQKAGRR